MKILTTWSSVTGLCGSSSVDPLTSVSKISKALLDINSICEKNWDCQVQCVDLKSKLKYIQR